MFEEFLNQLSTAKASAIIRADNQQLAADAMNAAIRGGFKFIEFTLTVPGAMELIQEFSQRKELIVGAGTVLTLEQAKEAVRRGARYLVSPVTDDVLIREATSWDIPMMPGTHTPTEMYRAHLAGAPVQKLFPAPANPAAFIQSVLAPMPFLRIVPTNGVDASNVVEVIKAGAFAVGFVKPLFQSALMKERNFQRIEETARELLSALRGSTP